MEQKKQEIILSTECENLKDCIYNMVYKFDNYVSCMNKYVPMIYKNDSIKDEYIDLIKFIFSEHENIIIQKGIRFMIESVDLISRKQNSFNKILTDFYKSDESIKYQIQFSTEIAEYFDIANNSFDTYSYTEKDFDPSIYLFTEYTKDRVVAFKKIINKFEMHTFTALELQNKINEYMLYALKIAKHTKKMSESSSTAIVTAKLTREMINLLVILLLILQTLTIVK